MRRPLHHSRIYSNLSLIVLIGFCLAMVACKPLTRSSTISPSRPDTHSAIAIDITTHLGDKQRFIRGDDISFLVNLDRDAYLLILYLDADRQLWQLIPNDYNPRSFFKAGDYLTIPDDQLPYKFVAAPPFGKETLYAFASDQAFPLFSYSLTRNGMFLIDDKLEDVLTSLRNDAKNKQMAFGEAELTIFTQDKLL